MPDRRKALMGAPWISDPTLRRCAQAIRCLLSRGLLSRGRMARGLPGLCLLALCALLGSGQAHAQAARTGNLLVLCAGISHYPTLQDPKKQLQFADDDCRGIGAWAEQQRGHLYNTVSVTLLLNEQATRSAILSSLLTMLNNATEQDLVLIFLAGHGVLSTSMNQYYFVSVDSQVSTDLSLASTALSQSDLVGAIDRAKVRSQKVLLVLDTCKSGAVALSGSAPGARGLRTTRDASPLPLDSKVRVNAILSAGSADVDAQEGPQYRHAWEADTIEGHGVFTWALLEAMGTRNADVDQNGQLFLSEIWGFVSAKVRAASHGEQLPESSGRMADFPLAWAPGTPERCDG